MGEKSLEHFQQKVDNIKSELDAIKKESTSSDLESKKKELDKKIYAANEAIDDELSDLKKDSDKNKETITKLEELKKTLSTFTPELVNLKQEVIESNSTDSKEAGKPSLLATIFYGGILGKVASKIPLIGDSIKEWADKKLKESGEEEKKEKEKTKDDNPGFWSKAWKWVGGAALVGGAIAVGSKAFSSEGGFWNTIKSWFSSGKKQEESDKTPVVPSENTNASADDTDIQNSETPGISEGDQGALIIPDTPVESHQDAQTINQKADKEIESMRSQNMSELYILIRMFELGFVPKVPSPKSIDSRNIFSYGGKKLLWGFEGGPLQKLGNMRSWLISIMKYSKDTILQQKLTAIKNNPSLVSHLDAQLAELGEMEKFLAVDNPDMKAFRKRFMGPDAKVKIEKIGRFTKSNQAKQSVESKRNKLTEVQDHVRTLDTQIADLQKNAQAKLAEYDKMAKEHQKDPKKLAEIRKQSEQYIKEYNAKISEAQKLLLEDISKVPNRSELLRMADTNISLKTLLKTNGGVDAILTKIKSSKLTKGVGRLGLALAVMKIVDGGRNDVNKQGFISKETGMDALDLGAGLIPVAGGIYDLTMAIRGKDLNGRKMQGRERWVRGGVGVASSVVDVFTFGAGGTALRVASKLGIKTAVKATEKVGVETVVKVAEKISVGAASKTVVKGLEVGMHVASYGFLGYTVYQMAAPVTISVGETVDHITESDVDLHVS